MKIRGHGNGLAIALAGLAVVLAATGTAYAVTTSTVKIGDAVTPSRGARVDNSGRLLVAGPYGTIDAAGYAFGYQTNTYTYLTSPTTASLAITRVRLSNPALNGTNKQQIALFKVGVDSAGKCTSTQKQNLGYYNLAAGQESLDSLNPPLLVRPTGTAKYCLALFIVATDTTPSYYVTYSVVGFAASGTYTGIGTKATPASVAARPAKIPSR